MLKRIRGIENIFDVREKELLAGRHSINPGLFTLSSDANWKTCPHAPTWQQRLACLNMCSIKNFAYRAGCSRSGKCPQSLK